MIYSLYIYFKKQYFRFSKSLHSFFPEGEILRELFNDPKGLKN